MKTYVDEEGHDVIVYSDGTKEWWKNGRIHREGDKPAAIDRDGNQLWFKNGRIHREDDKPAVITNHEDNYWYNNGMFHRENNPAYIGNEGTDFWLNMKSLDVKDYWIRLLLLEY